MSTGEAAGYDDRLRTYHAIDSSIAVGSVPIEQCRELRAACEDMNSLSPDARYEYAWVGLEAALAMHREPDPQTGSPFKPKEINAAVEQTRAELKALAGDESASMSIRARAQLTFASVGMHVEFAKNQRFKKDSKNHVPYLRGLQRAAGMLLAEENRSPQDEDLLRAMTSIAVLTEYTQETGWFLPTSPRQSWHINCINRRSGYYGRILMAEDAPEDIIPIPLATLADEVWSDEGYKPHATLSNYMQMTAGFAQFRAKKPTFARLALDNISDRHLWRLNEYRERLTAPAQAAGALAVAAETAQPESRPEISWYLAQSAHDIRDISPSALTANMRNVETQQADRVLTPEDEYALGWMQLDHARLTAMQTNAAETDEQATSVIAARFDAARDTFIAAAQSLPKERMGETFEMHLASEAALVYKALATDATPAELTEATNTYTRKLAGLYLKMREGERLFKNNQEQQDALYAAALQATFCLLLVGSTDEAERHLALPASMRAGGSRGQQDIVVFPFNFVTDSYDTAAPVHVQLFEGHDIAQDGAYLTVGWDALTLKGQKLGLLAKLVAAGRAAKPGARQKARGEEIDAIATRIGDAIADAAG